MTVFTSSVLCSPTVDRDNCHAFHFERDTYIHTYLHTYVCMYIYIYIYIYIVRGLGDGKF